MDVWMYFEARQNINTSTPEHPNTSTLQHFNTSTPDNNLVFLTFVNANIINLAPQNTGKQQVNLISLNENLQIHARHCR
jgi:hypothetical protein